MSGARGPMKMVAFGDSVMWGQGLTHEQKFVVKAARAIAAIEGTTLVGGDVEILAHSGAIISSSASEREAFATRWEYLFNRNATLRADFIAGRDVAQRVLGNQAIPGELSRPYPTVLDQMQEYARTTNPLDVDVVFADGGGNDIDFTSFLSPEGTQPDDIQKVREILFPRFDELATHALKTFPNAVVILNGYYPLLSADTNDERVKEMFYAFKNIPWYAELVNEIYGDSGSRFALELGLVATLWIAGIAVASAAASKKQDMVALAQFAKTRVWQTYHIVATIMREISTTSHSSRLLFCDPFFDRQNALFTAESMVFEGYDPNAMRDPVAQQRRAQADAEIAQLEAFYGPGKLSKAREDKNADPHLREVAGYFASKVGLWRQMSFLHPNAAGAQAFADAIVHRYRLWRDGSLRASILPRGGSLRVENRLQTRRTPLSVKAFEVASKLDSLMLRIGGTYNFFQYFETMFDLVVRLGLKVPQQGREFIEVSLQREAGTFYTNEWGDRFYAPPDDFPFNWACFRAYSVLVDKQRAQGGSGLYFADIAWIEIRGVHRPGAKPIYRRNEPNRPPPDSGDRCITRVLGFFDGLLPILDARPLVDFVPGPSGEAYLRFPLP